MTIARRLIVLVSVPLLALIGLGVFVKVQLAEIETSSRFVSEMQVPSLVALGNISRTFAELRVSSRGFLLNTDKAQQAKAMAAFQTGKTDLDKLLREYADILVADNKDRRLLDEYRDLSNQWIAGAEKGMAIAGEGRREEALVSLQGPVMELGTRLSKVSSEWIAYNEQLATKAGKSAIDAIEQSRLRIFIAVGIVLMLSGTLGFLTFRRIANPIQALQTSVDAIARGDYAKEVPFTKAADETGALARSVDVLKQGAAAMEQQRWVKCSAAKITGELQGAASLAEFGQRLLSGLVPVLGGGVAGFYAAQACSDRLLRIAGYGLPPGSQAGDSFGPGEGLVGQCARDRKPVILADLPGNYLRVSSGLGGAAPAQSVAWPLLSGDTLLGVVEFASFKALHAQETTLLEELLPVVAMSLEILQRNLSTQELLEQTQEQARQLEEQTEELTRSQEELLAQKDELVAQQDELTAQQERLQVSEERTRLILESSVEGIFGVDTEGRIDFANPAACRMLGFNAEEFIGQPSHSLIHHHHPDGSEYPQEECPMFAAYKQGKTSRVDNEFLWCKDGAGLPVEYGATPICKDGAIIGAVISFTDITERKQAERELKVAMKKAEEATQAKSAFLANMSHEIRTPMNGIIGMTELALDTELSTEQRDYLNTVKSSADALLTLINDILDFSKIEAGRIELDPIEFLLRDAVADTLNPLALRASSKALELTYDVHPDVPDALVADIYRMRQVMVNLVGNAIKFTEHGEVVVSVRTLERVGDALTLEVAVRDTGIGISPANLAKLFRPFEQADASTTRKYGGTGLGLAISRQLVELMGGQLRVESRPGEGSTFLFTVRCKAGTPRPSIHSEEAARLLAQKTALIVDDNETNRTILTAMTGHWGLHAVQADSAQQAMAALDRAANAGQPVSLIITDLHMPETDGFGLMEQIRSNPRYAELPAILLSSSASQGDQDRCGKLHIAARLLKPVKQSLLLDNIMRVLAVDARAPMAKDETAKPRSDGPATASLRVLLAEDHPINRKFAIRLLEGAGHTVLIAENGAKAVAAWEAETLDLILMDIQMPEMDGLEATREIRRRESALGRHMPIIAMTANAMKGDREMCLEAGMDGYVAKPVKKDELFAEIGRLVGKGKSNG